MSFYEKLLGLLKSMRPSTSASSSPGFVDEYRRMPEPTKRSLLEGYKQTVYTCSLMNAVAVASQTLRLYATTGPGEPKVKRFQTKSITTARLKDLQSRSHLQALPHFRKAVDIQEIVEHPAINLLYNPNPFFDSFSFMEMTDLLGEITGVGYWQVMRGTLGQPVELWVLPTQLVSPVKDVDGYTKYYNVNGTQAAQVKVEDIIPFSFPNLIDPYSPEGISPLRAYFETSKLTGKLLAYNHSLMDNRARPEVLLLPKDQLGEAEAARLEKRFMQKFRRGGNGGVMVLDAAMKAELLQFSNKDLEMLALSGASKEDICNAYDVPFSMVNIKDSNRATSEAGHYQHARNAIWPRCRRIEGKLNKHYAPQFDGRLFFAYDCPVPSDIQNKMLVREQNLKLGVTVINEERAEDGMTPVDWGDRPILPMNMMPLTEEDVTGEGRRGNPATAPDGRNSKEDTGNVQENDAKAITSRKRAKAKRPGLACTEKAGHIHDSTWAKLSAGRPSGTGHKRALPSGFGLEQELQAAFSEQKKDVMNGIRAKVGFLIKHSDPPPLLDEEWTKRLSASVYPHLKQYYDQGSADVIERYSIAKGKALSDRPYVDEAIKQASAKLATITNKTTSAELDEAVSRLKSAIVRGTPTEDAIKTFLEDVNTIFESAHDYRAGRIARTESSRALHSGQLLQLKDSGLKVKLYWDLAENPCPTCIAISEATKDGVTPGDMFTQLADNYQPYDKIFAPPAHPDCQCTMREELDSE